MTVSASSAATIIDKVREWERSLSIIDKMIIVMDSWRSLEQQGSLSQELILFIAVWLHFFKL